MFIIISLQKLRNSIRPTSLCDCGVTGCDICCSDSEAAEDKTTIN